MLMYCKRDPLFDLLKGVGLILMIWVHCKTIAISHFAYTFHMPLFLIVSGYFYKCRSFKEELYLDFRRILIPYVFTCIFMGIIAYAVIDGFSLGSTTQKALFSPLWGGAVFGHLRSITQEPLFIGPLWFLIALFWVRIFLNILLRLLKNEMLCGCILFVLAILANCVYEIVGHIPLSILQSFGCMGFFYFGIIARRHDLFGLPVIKKMFPICALCWLYCMTFSRLALHDCKYEGYYILDILSSWGAISALFVLIKSAYTENVLWKIIRFVGENSLVVLCVHAADHCLFNRWTSLYHEVELAIGPALSAFIRVAYAIAIAYLITKSKWLYKNVFYHVK